MVHILFFQGIVHQTERGLRVKIIWKLKTNWSLLFVQTSFVIINTCFDCKRWAFFHFEMPYVDKYYD
jgi:hypothetical protein